MEHVNCDYCGSAESQVVAHQTDLLHRTTDEIFTIVRCLKCGLHYTNPRPRREDIGHYYASSYSFHASLPRWRQWIDQGLDLLANSPLAITATVVPPLARRLVARIRPRIHDPVLEYYHQGGTGVFLDIGCGAGRRAHYWGWQSSLSICHRWMEVAGIEVSESARQSLCEMGVQCWPDLASVPESRRFGLIRMNWSLEHVHSPNAYFSFIAAHLQVGGRAVITVPNYDGLIYRLAPNCVELPIHLYHFRPQDIVAYAKRHGLSVLGVTTFSYPEMFRFAAEVGLLPAAFPAQQSIIAAKGMERTLAPFSRAGWGNDMLVVLEHT